MSSSKLKMLIDSNVDYIPNHGHFYNLLGIVFDVSEGITSFRVGENLIKQALRKFGASV